ncbi:hypothetical protein MRX96_023727 [Rhipicephalus microplus]
MIAFCGNANEDGYMVSRRTFCVEMRLGAPTLEYFNEEFTAIDDGMERSRARLKKSLHHGWTLCGTVVTPMTRPRSRLSKGIQCSHRP